MNESINLTMAAVFVALGCMLALALIEPSFMRWLCARGLSWAACVEAFKRSRPKETKYWDKVLGVTPRSLLVQDKDEA